MSGNGSRDGGPTTGGSEPTVGDEGSASSAEGLAPFRKRLDELDEQIASLLGERFQICREVAHYKSEHQIPMMQPARVEQVRARYLERGAEARLPEDFTGALFELLIGATCKMEDELIAAASAGSASSSGSTPSSSRPTS